MRILVTGAAGFVGSHLCRDLRAHGHDVFESDIGQVDLSVPGAATRLVRQAEPEYVVHLAARYGRILCRDEPHRSVQDNAAATTELAAVCLDREIPVLYTSSSEVYGDHGEATISEDTQLRMPTTIYGLSKLWGEQALQLYLPPERLCIVRMNMLFGPGQAAGYGRCALATFISDAIENKPLHVHRDASRSWLYISDAVKALRILVEGGHTGVFNLGNDTERESVEDTAWRVVRMAGGTVRLHDAPANQIRHKNYSSAKLRAAIGWKPEVTLAEGIRATVQSQRKEKAWQTRSVTRSSAAAL